MKAAGKAVTIVHINDVFDPLEYRDAVEHIYVALPEGWTDNDVIVDFTGMTSCGSVGSVLAAVHRERPIQIYARAVRRRAEGDAASGSDRDHH